MTLDRQKPLTRQDRDIRRAERIQSFLEQNNHRAEKFSDGELLVLVLGPKEQNLAEVENASKNWSVRLRALRLGWKKESGPMAGACQSIAESNLQTPNITGTMSSFSGTEKFIEFGSHDVNLAEFGDGTVAAVDFTARENCSVPEQSPDLLVVVASSIPELKNKLNALYGGDWKQRVSATDTSGGKKWNFE